MKPVALRLLGKPNERLSRKKNELRFGTHGSMAVNIATGEFFDHEAKVGGGVLDLVAHKRGGDRSAASAWLREEKFLPETEPKISAEYDYTDEQGKLLFQVVRYVPKTFKQRRPDGNGGWIWNMDGVRRVLFQLPEVIDAVAAGITVHVVEGEKDALALRELGLVATTCPGGALKWRREYNASLRGADIVLHPHNDKAGHDHEAQVSAFLHGIAKRVRVLDIAKHWPECGEGQDISDWLQAGGAIDQLTTFIDQLSDHTYRPESLRSFAFIDDAPPAPQPMLIEDVLPRDGLTFIGGQSSAGKSFIAVLMAACAATGKPFFGREVRETVGSVIVAAEGRAMLRNRILAALKELDVEAENVPISWLKGIPDFSNEQGLLAFIEKLNVLSNHFTEKFRVRLGLVFVDTVSASFDLEEEADNAEAARVCKIMQRIAEKTGAIVVPIHHYGKNAAVGLRGASAWRASADIVLSVTADIDATTGHVTNRQLSLAKDRDGAQGALTAFTLKPVELGVDENGKPFGSMVAITMGDTAQTLSAWPPGLTTFRQALRCPDY
jgi:hypothetical protein